MGELERQKRLGPEEEPVEAPQEGNVGTCGVAKNPGLRRGGGWGATPGLGGPRLPEGREGSAAARRGGLFRIWAAREVSP